MNDSPHGFHIHPAWPSGQRKIATSLWTGFIGASFMLLGLLMGWEHLWPDSERTDWSTLAILFSMAWLVCILTAVMAQALATPPKAYFQPDTLEDEHD